MNITEKQQSENNNFVPFVGFFEADVVSINPTLDQLKELLNTENIEREPEYLREDDQGNTQLILDFWLKEKEAGKHFKLTFWLTDELVESDYGKRYVNCVGDSSTADDTENLRDFFKNFKRKDEIVGEKIFRQARKGEQYVYEFIKAWGSGIDFFSPETSILLNWEKLMRGDVSELRSMIGESYTSYVICLAEATLKDTEDGTKAYQKVFSKNFLPGYRKDALSEAINTGKWEKNKAIGWFHKQITGQYGARGVYILDWLQQYSEDMTIASNSQAIDNSDLDSSY